MIKQILLLIDKALVVCIRYVNIFHLYILNKYKNKETKYKFLTANDKADNIEEYSLALKEALDDKRVKNIAISGSYGSGKSSFIKTFEKNNSQYRFLDISLAKFNNKNEKNSNTSDLSLIEKSILEQMFYKVKNKTIPQSRLNKIDRLKLMPLKIIGIILFVTSYFIVFQPKVIESISILNNLLKINTIDYLRYAPFVILMFGIYYVIQKLLIIISNTNIEKINLKNMELISNDKNGSLLNKYLDEILYFFERTNFHVVVFQDLDRFGNLDIFTKLRELNNFINNSEQVNKKIVFIYAVKDEMFKNQHERTKFFDFLIPVIPYINSANSKDKLIEYFPKDINRKFLYDISLYISDMRLLKNIYNEYEIYSTKLDNKLNKTKLLAMIIYKNFEPQDFEELHESKGNVYNVFNNKNEYIKLFTEQLDKEISSTKNNNTKQIENINNHNIEDIKELRKLYIFEIIKSFGGNFNGNIYIQGQGYSIDEILEDDNFKLLTTNSFVCNRYDNPITFDNIENIIGNYIKREKLIIAKKDGSKNKLLQEIKDLENKKEDIQYLNIEKIIENYGDSEIYKNEYFKDKTLLKYLINYGWINEYYEDYISSFFGVSITKNEQEFLLNIKNNGKHLKFDHKLTNIDDLVSNRLGTGEFKKESILNFDLVNTVMSNKIKYEKEYAVLFQQLASNNTTTNKFIIEFMNTQIEIESFLNSLVNFYPSIWLYINSDKFNKKEINNYFHMFVNSLDYDKISEIININNTFTNYIKSIDKLNISLDNIKDNIFKLIKNFDIKFNKLNMYDISNDFRNYIYDGNYYEINEFMINQILIKNHKEKSQKEVENKLKISNFTTIKNNNVTKLIDYIENNIEKYISNVLLKIETNTQESEEIIIELLNNDEINNKLKEQIIIKQENKIQDITTIKEESLWTILLKQNFILSSWDNIFEYYNYEEKSNDIIIDFLDIKENARIIAKKRCDKKYSEANELFTHDLLKLIIKTNKINNESYEYIIENLGWRYTDLDITDLDESKISLLIKYNRFQFKKVCFDMIKENTKTLQIELLEKNKAKLLDKFEEFEFDTDDIIDILQSVNISNSIKKDLIEKIDYDLISNETIAKLIYKYVDKKDIKGIYYTKKMLENLEVLESKINLIVEQESEFNDKELVELLYLLPSEYSKIANLDGKQTTLKDTDYNKEFIKILKEKDLITKDKIEKNKQIRLWIKKKDI